MLIQNLFRLGPAAPEAPPAPTKTPEKAPPAPAPKKPAPAPNTLPAIPETEPEPGTCPITVPDADPNRTHPACSTHTWLA